MFQTQSETGSNTKKATRNASRREWIQTAREAAYIHEVLLHVVGEVLEHCDLADEVFRNLACGEDGALTELCIVMDGPAKKRKD